MTNEIKEKVLEEIKESVKDFGFTAVNLERAIELTEKLTKEGIASLIGKEIERLKKEQTKEFTGLRGKRKTVKFYTNINEDKIQALQDLLKEISEGLIKCERTH